MEPQNPTAEHLISEAQLKSWTQFSQTAALMDFLKHNGIAYFRGRGGSVITTVEEVNAALSNDRQKKIDW